MTKAFNFTGLDHIDGRWVSTPRTGTGKVIERGFQMQLGADGYVLEVIESPHYAAGEIIRVYPHSVRSVQA